VVIGRKRKIRAVWTAHVQISRLLNLLGDFNELVNHETRTVKEIKEHEG